MLFDEKNTYGHKYLSLIIVLGGKKTEQIIKIQGREAKLLRPLNFTYYA